MVFELNQVLLVWVKVVAWLGLGSGHRCWAFFWCPGIWLYVECVECVDKGPVGGEGTIGPTTYLYEVYSSRRDGT